MQTHFSTRCETQQQFQEKLATLINTSPSEWLAGKVNEQVETLLKANKHLCGTEEMFHLQRTLSGNLEGVAERMKSVSDLLRNTLNKAPLSSVKPFQGDPREEDFLYPWKNLDLKGVSEDTKRCIRSLNKTCFNMHPEAIFQKEEVETLLDACREMGNNFESTLKLLFKAMMRNKSSESIPKHQSELKEQIQSSNLSEEQKRVSASLIDKFIKGEYCRRVVV